MKCSECFHYPVCGLMHMTAEQCEHYIFEKGVFVFSQDLMYRWFDDCICDLSDKIFKHKEEKKRDDLMAHSFPVINVGKDIETMDVSKEVDMLTELARIRPCIVVDEEKFLHRNDKNEGGNK